MRNIYKDKNNSWKFQAVIKGKKYRKSFKSKIAAESYARNFFDARKMDLIFFSNLSGEQLKDIRDALEILPKGKTLSESVQKAWKHSSDFDFQVLADEFYSLKSVQYEKGKLSKDEWKHIKGRITNIKSNFNSFDDINRDKIRDFLKVKGAIKTISHWKTTFSELLDFCIKKEAITLNPINIIHHTELLNEDYEENGEIGILAVDSTKEFMEYLELKEPIYCKFYALALFSGIRVSEIPRLKEEYFKYDTKQIIFPAQIGKVKKAWTLENLPDNLWMWLNKYKSYAIERPSNRRRNELGKKFNLPHNFARHSFSTYHLSMYFDFSRTARITRNSEQILKNKYMSCLVAKEIAEQYFNIYPK